jgi:predicted metal-dependent hydrolase
VSSKSIKIATLVAYREGYGVDARYLVYVDFFNQQQYYEAHDVLEDLWLMDRQGPDGRFHKGLIQLAGAFVHVQKRRPTPATSLLKLAEGNLRTYPSVHWHLNLERVAQMIAAWLELVSEHGSASELLLSHAAPRLNLEGSAFQPVQDFGHK